MYDVIIVGGGPAGLSAAVYTSRFRLKTLVISSTIGGLITEAFRIENYLGFKSISGEELIKKFYEHASTYGAKIVRGEKVITIEKKDGIFRVITDVGNEYEGMAVILAIGLKKRDLNIPGEKKFKGRGVSYCAVCDAPFFEGKNVAVIGGGPSAITGALKLADVVRKVYIIYGKGQEDLNAERIWVERALSNPKIEFIFYTSVKEICGKESVEYIVLDKQYKGSTRLDVEGVFIETDFASNENLIEQLGIETEDGLIKINEDCSTNVEGIFAAGDVTTGSNRLRQIVTAAAEGAIAANSVLLYLKRRSKQ